MPLSEIVDEVDKLAEGSSEAIESPDDEGVANLQFGECSVETGAMEVGTGDALVGEDEMAVGMVEGVDLEFEVLFVCGDAGVADFAGRGGLGVARKKRRWFVAGIFHDVAKGECG
ncbi:hypothetical protein WI61_38650 [Burkholderia cepacia]|nr:hypothetical protein WI61_38650 [Burkholderia cepacia]KVC01815.1 hypothetical protein WI66_06735 [Burkholderia cepacia]KVC03110.1 hypothetical protein WI65_36685 [Burkholderia cepacia]